MLDRIRTKAAAQHDVISGRQLRQLGVDGPAVAALIDRGLLEIVMESGYDTAYIVDGRSFTWLGRCLAATMVAGERAVISHRTAAMLHGLIPLDESLPIEVTVPV